MNLSLPHSLLTQYLKTTANPEKIANCLSLCGPTVDHLTHSGSDVVYELEIITNRVDSASAFGIAREAAAILPEFSLPANLINDPYQNKLSQLGHLPNKLPVKVKITDSHLVPRFTCIALKNVKLQPSPQEVQTWLTLSGQRPLNNLVDITNELTLKYGQPVHIFDLDRLGQSQLTVRLSRPSEKIITLDGQTHTLPGGDIVIEAGDGRLIDLCGIMGGGLSSVSPTTKNVLLFVQTYDPLRIRRTSLATQTRTLAAQLFEKKPDSQLVLPVLIEGVKLIQARANGQLSSNILDLYPKPYVLKTVDLNLNWLAQFAGITLPPTRVAAILTRLGLTVTPVQPGHLSCLIPSFRQSDLSTPEDLSEEVMRVYGYYRLPSVIPPSSVTHSDTPPLLFWESRTRTYLAHLGLTEIYNHSLISSALAKNADCSLVKAFKLQNPFSKDFEYMRPSLLPSLLSNLSHNHDLVRAPLRLFELSNIYLPLKNSPLAYERSTLAIAFWGDEYLSLKGYLESLARWLKLTLKIDPLHHPPAPFSPTQTALISLDPKTPLGYLGLCEPSIATRFNLDPVPYLLELDFACLSLHASTIHHFHPVPAHPPIIEDLTFTLPPKTNIGPVLNTLKQVNPLIYSVSLKTIFGQNYTFTLTYQHLINQLKDTDLIPVRKQIVTSLAINHHATLVGQLT